MLHSWHKILFSIQSSYFLMLYCTDIKYKEWLVYWQQWRTTPTEERPFGELFSVLAVKVKKKLKHLQRQVTQIYTAYTFKFGPWYTVHLCVFPSLILHRGTFSLAEWRAPPIWCDYSHYSQMSEVQSPPGYRSSWAKTGPSGSAPKSTRKSSFSLRPPFTVSTSICIITEPSLKQKQRGQKTTTTHSEYQPQIDPHTTSYIEVLLTIAMFHCSFWQMKWEYFCVLCCCSKLDYRQLWKVVLFSSLYLRTSLSILVWSYYSRQRH